MTVSNSATVKIAKLDQEETTVGTAPVLRLYNGTLPADVDTALSGNTLLAQGTLPSDWMAGASAAGNVVTKAKAGTWTLTGQSGAGAGTPATMFRLFNTAGTTAHKQGNAGANTVIATNALTAVNGNVLNFAATTGVAVGQKVTGTGVKPNTNVIAFTGTTVTISESSTAGVANAASITFGYDMVLDNNNIANAQSLTVSQFDITAGN